MTSDTVSPWPRLLVRIVSARFASSSLSGDCIEPETSTRNTRLAGLRSCAVFALVATPTRTMWRPGASGDGAASMITLNGESLCGVGNA